MILTRLLLQVDKTALGVLFQQQHNFFLQPRPLQKRPFIPLFISLLPLCKTTFSTQPRGLPTKATLQSKTVHDSHHHRHP